MRWPPLALLLWFVLATPALAVDCSSVTDCQTPPTNADAATGLAVGALTLGLVLATAGWRWRPISLGQRQPSGQRQRRRQPTIPPPPAERAPSTPGDGWMDDEPETASAEVFGLLDDPPTGQMADERPTGEMVEERSTGRLVDDPPTGRLAPEEEAPTGDHEPWRDRPTHPGSPTREPGRHEPWRDRPTDPGGPYDDDQPTMRPRR